VKLHSPAAGEEIPHAIRIAQAFGGSARTERVGPDDDSDRLTMARDDHLLASEDTLEDLREGRSSLADGYRVRHACIVRRCTALDNAVPKRPVEADRESPTPALRVDCLGSCAGLPKLSASMAASVALATPGEARSRQH
jgi:hypothetical protein